MKDHEQKQKDPEINETELTEQELEKIVAGGGGCVPLPNRPC